MTANRGLLRIVAVVAVGLLLAVAVPSAVSAGPAIRAEDANTALSTAISNLEGQGYNIDATVGSNASGGGGAIAATGSVDPNSNAAKAEFKGNAGGEPVDIQFVQTPDSLYAKIDIKAIQSQLGFGPNVWIKLDESKITDKSNLPFDLSGKTDAINIEGLMTSVSGVSYPDPSDQSQITGTVDLTAASGVGAPDKSDLQKAGAAAKTTPFAATVDDQGRLTALKVDADKFDGSLTQDLKFTDFGSQDTVSVPTQSTPAPDAAYQFFNN